MPTSLTIPDGYGYTVLIALGLIPILGIGQGSVVTTLRKPAKVPYPNAYATPEQVKSSKEAYKFNCAQRAHGNLLENMPMAISTLMFAGLFYPQATPILGLVWVISRAFYAYGYIATEKPDGINLPESKSGRWGAGLTRTKMAECRWLKPKLVGQFEFVEWTEGNHLRHTKFVGLRTDKQPRDVHRE